MPMVPATGESEVDGLWSEADPEQKASDTT
jgi:hypothetical protein